MGVEAAAAAQRKGGEAEAELQQMKKKAVKKIKSLEERAKAVEEAQRQARYLVITPTIEEAQRQAEEKAAQTFILTQPLPIPQRQAEEKDSNP